MKHTKYKENARRPQIETHIYWTKETRKLADKRQKLQWDTTINKKRKRNKREKCESRHGPTQCNTVKNTKKGKTQARLRQQRRIAHSSKKLKAAQPRLQF